MNGIDMFLVQYGLLALFAIMFIKSIGVPIPIPADLLILTAAVRVAQGKLVGWQAFLAILVALTLGGLLQYALARGPGRNLLYRFGRYVGLTGPRLDAAAGKVKKGGLFGVSLAILVPGVRGAAIAAAGLADMSLGLFLPGLVVGSLLFLSLHFFLGIVGGSALFALGHVFPLSTFILVVLALFVLVYALWAYASRRQRAARAEIAQAAQRNEAQEGEALEVWHEGICPVCLALYAANQLRTYTADQFTV